ncbi:unnamed protein product, partial [Didymodactylos carnosus]
RGGYDTREDRGRNRGGYSSGFDREGHDGRSSWQSRNGASGEQSKFNTWESAAPGGHDRASKLAGRHDEGTTIRFEAGHCYDDFVLPTTEIKFVLSHVNTPTQFFIQLLTKADEISQLSDTLQREFKAAPVVNASSLKFGQVCLSKHTDECWYRASVLTVDGNKANVKYIDFGNCDDVDTKNIRQLSKKYTSPAPFAYPCLLKDTQAVENVDLRTVIHAVDGKEFQGTIESKADETFILVSDNLSNLLKDLKVIRMNKQFFTLMSITKNTMSATVAQANTPDEFYLHDDEKSTCLSQLMKQLSQEYTSTASVSDIKLQVNQPCAALVYEQWHRGYINSIENDVLSIKFIDYGTQSIVQKEDIRPLNAKYFKEPAFAIRCSLSGSHCKEWTEVDDFFDAIVDKPLAVDLQSHVQPILVKLTLKDEPEQKFESYSLKSEYPPHVPLFDPGLSVIVSIYSSPNTFYVQPKDADVDCTAINEKLRVYAETEEIIILNQSHKYQKDEFCIAQFTTDQQWNRAKILSIEQENVNGNTSLLYSVIYIDFGNTEKLKHDSLRPYDPETGAMPRLAYHCELNMNDVDDNTKQTLSEQERDKIEDLLCHHDFQIELVNIRDEQSFKNNETQPIKINAFLNGQSIIDMVRKKDEQKPQTIDQPAITVLNNKQEHVTIKPQPTCTAGSAVTLPSATTSVSIKQDDQRIPVTISYIEKDKHYFYVQTDTTTVNQISNIIEQEMDIAQVLSIEDVRQLLKNDLVISMYDGAPFRAVLSDDINNSEDNVYVYFVDYGNVDSCVSTTLKKCSNELSVYPYQARRCFFHGIQNDKLDTLFEELDSYLEAADVEMSIVNQISPNESNNLTKTPSVDASSVLLYVKGVCLNEKYGYQPNTTSTSLSSGLSNMDTDSQTHDSVLTKSSTAAAPQENLERQNSIVGKRTNDEINDSSSSDQQSSTGAVKRQRPEPEISSALLSSIIETGFLTHVDPVAPFIYVQTSADIDTQLERVNGLIEKIDKKTPGDTYNVGDYCIAQFSVDNVYYRAKIQSIDNDSYTVFFIDYGNIDENLEKSKLLDYSDELKSIEALAKCFQLSNIDRTKWTKNIFPLVNSKLNEVIEFYYKNEQKTEIHIKFDNENEIYQSSTPLSSFDSTSSSSNKNNSEEEEQPILQNGGSDERIISDTDMLSDTPVEKPADVSFTSQKTSTPTGPENGSDEQQRMQISPSNNDYNEQTGIRSSSTTIKEKQHTELHLNTPIKPQQISAYCSKHQQSQRLKANVCGTSDIYFFIHIVPESEAEICKVDQLLQEHEKHNKSSFDEWKLNDLCIVAVEDSDEQMYYRGQIMKINSSTKTFDIKRVDYGNTLFDIPFKRLFELNNDTILKIRFIANKCRLYAVEDDYMQYAIMDIKDTIGHEDIVEIIVIDQTEDYRLVILFWNDEVFNDRYDHYSTYMQKKGAGQITTSNGHESSFIGAPQAESTACANNTTTGGDNDCSTSLSNRTIDFGENDMTTVNDETSKL